MQPSCIQVTSQAAELETFYLFWAATLVFSMQMGFAMLSAGAVRQKNVQNIMLKAPAAPAASGLSS